MAWEYKTLNWHIATGRDKTTLEYVYEAGAGADEIRTIAERPHKAEDFDVTATIDDVLDEYGRDGWELVTALPLVRELDSRGQETTTMAVRYTFKRARS